MMHNFFKKREEDQELGAEIKAAMSFRMDDESRDRIRERLVSYAKMKPVRPLQVRTVRRSWTWIVFHPVPVASLILLVAMGGTAGAAESALPGDLLYPIKVSVNEEVRVALATTPEKKAAVAIARAETRLEELEELEARGTIDIETHDEAEERLDAQIRIAEEQTLELEDENGGRVERETRFIAVLRAHENRLVRDRGEGRGGSLDDVVVDAAVIAAAPVEEPVVAMLAMDVSLEANATEIVETPPEPAAFAARSAETAQVEVAAPVAKQEAPSFDARKVRRQERAAEQRIDALERLLERLEKRDGSYVEARTALERAQEDLAAGSDALEAENLAEASFLFDVALKTAIDARELLTNTPPTPPQQPVEEKPQAKQERKRDPRTQQAASAAVVASSSTSIEPEEIEEKEDGEETATSTEKEEKKDEGGLRSYLNRKLNNETGIRFWK